MENNNSKPFWNYMKAKKRDNIEVATLKQKGFLSNESKEKANILVTEFKSMFTRHDATIQATVPKRKLKHKLTELKIQTNG